MSPLGIDHAPSKRPLLRRRPGISGLGAPVDDLDLCAMEIDAKGIADLIAKTLGDAKSLFMLPVNTFHYGYGRKPLLFVRCGI